jgi:cytochrome b
MHHNDQPAAFKGLIITAILLFVMAYGIVQWTNSRFASHAAAPAGATKH